MNEAETMQLAKWAEVGARTRLQELDEEKASIYRVFPMLEPRATGELAPVPEAPRTNGRAKRPPMTAAQRKAISKRMRKFWREKNATAVS
jgi:hypothetical protein